jgi:hypothetical protein
VPFAEKLFSQNLENLPELEPGATARANFCDQALGFGPCGGAWGNFSDY